MLAWNSRTVVALLGPVAAGAAMRAGEGGAAALAAAGLVPVILLGVAGIMAPALYIGSTLIAPDLQARRLARGVGDSLRDIGVVLAGLAPALLVLIVTSTDPSTLVVLGHAVVALAVLLGLVRLYGRLFDDATRPVWLFAAWALVGLGIGQQLLLEVLRWEVGG